MDINGELQEVAIYIYAYIRIARRGEFVCARCVHEISSSLIVDCNMGNGNVFEQRERVEYKCYMMDMIAWAGREWR